MSEMIMEEFLCDLITASSGDGLSSGAGDGGGCGGRPDPDLQSPVPIMPAAASGPVIIASTSTSMMASSSSSSSTLLGRSSTSSQMQPVVVAAGPSSIPLGNLNLNNRSSSSALAVPGPSSAVGMRRSSGNENSILTTDVTHMIAWLNSQNHSQISSGSLGSAGSQYAGSQYEVETSRIPKPYNGMNPNDCASVVAKSIRSIIMHTCNDDFRQQCFEKLEVSSSREAEFEVRRRLNEMLLQQTQETASVSVSSPNTK